MTDFKIILTRLPNVGATSVQGAMTKDAFLSLECHSVTLTGAAGSGVFGMPKQVNSDPKVKEWLLGLREGGGGGCVVVSWVTPDKSFQLIPAVTFFATDLKNRSNRIFLKKQLGPYRRKK